MDFKIRTARGTVCYAWFSPASDSAGGYNKGRHKKRVPAEVGRDSFDDDGNLTPGRPVAPELERCPSMDLGAVSFSG